MTFSQHGFEQVIIDFDSKYSSWFSDISDSKYTISFDLSKYFLTDRQSAKRMFLKRNPELLDVYVNRSIYGSDIEKNIGAGYKIWISDNDITNPEIVKVSETRRGRLRFPDEDLDSPYQPLTTSSEIYERIDDIKRQLKSDSYNLEYVNLHVEEEMRRIYKMVQELRTFSVKKEEEYLNISISSSSIFIISILGIMENIITIISNCQLNLENSKKSYLNFKYLEFVIFPESLNGVLKRLSEITDELMSKESYLRNIEQTIKDFKSELYAIYTKTSVLDDNISKSENTLATAYDVWIAALALAATTGTPITIATATLGGAVIDFYKTKKDSLIEKSVIISEFLTTISTIPEPPVIGELTTPPIPNLS